MCLVGLLTLACVADSKPTPIVVPLSGWTGTNSRRNFHRPESNCGMALNCGWRVFIVLQSRLRLQIHQRQSKITTPINGLSAANQKEMFQSEFSGVGFLFILFSQAPERRNFTQREIAFVIPRAPHQGDRSATWDIFPLLGDDFSPVRFA